MPATSETFRKFRGELRVLVETGSYRGDGIQAAIDAGFQRVISLEIQPHLVKHCLERFADKKGVTVLEGDSGKLIGKAIADLKEPFLCWLDGHFSGGDTGRGFRNAPV